MSDVALVWQFLLQFWRYRYSTRQMKPYRERIAPESGSSICRLNRRLDDGIPFQWHHHPEFELTLTLNSRGQRFVGDHVGEYDDGDFVLLGPNIPHTWFSREKISAGPHVALVVWFHPDWADQAIQPFAELGGLRRLLTRAGRGLHFSMAADTLRTRFSSLFECAPAERLLTLLSVLEELSRQEANSLATKSPLKGTTAEERDRIDRVLSHLHENYVRAVSLSEIAEVACLSESGVHRMFFKHTGKTISAYLAHMRVGDACARLAGTTQPVSYIADAVGYTSLANFNRQFRALRKMSPREYRRLFTESDSLGTRNKSSGSGSMSSAT
jgi:AraC-like DNA-binding protein